MIRLFHRYRVVLSCGFFLLVSLGLAAVNRRASYPIDPVGVVLLEVMHPLQIGVTTASHYVGLAWGRYVALWSLRQENEELHKRVQELERTVRRADEVERANRRLGKLIELENRLGDLGKQTVAARIVGRSPSVWVKTVVLGQRKQPRSEQGHGSPCTRRGCWTGGRCEPECRTGTVSGRHE